MQEQKNDAVEIEAGDTRIRFGGRMSWAFMAQLAIIIAIIVGIFKPTWAISIIEWLIDKLEDTGARLQTAYFGNINNVKNWFRTRAQQAGWAIRILSIIFLVILGLVIYFYAAGQPVYAAIALLALIFLPWLLAVAINFEQLSIIVAPLAAGLTWALVFVLSMIIFPVDTIDFGLRLAGLIVLMILGTAGMAAGKRGQAIPMVIAILCALFMLVYGASGWVQTKIEKIQSSAHLNKTETKQDIVIDKRKAEAIAENIPFLENTREEMCVKSTFLYLVVNNQIVKTTWQAQKNEMYRRALKINQDIDDNPVPQELKDHFMNPEQQFKFIFGPDEDGNWTKTTNKKGWAPTENFLPQIRKRKNFEYSDENEEAEKPKTTYLESISAGTDEATWFPGRGQKKLSKGTTFVIQSTDLAGWEWFFNNQSWARYNVNDPPVAIPDGAREVELRGAPNPGLGRRRKFTVTY